MSSLLQPKRHAARGCIIFFGGTRISTTAKPDSSVDEGAFRELANVLPQIVWIAAPDKSVIFLNDRYYEYTGLSREIPGLAGWELVVHADDRDSAMSAWMHAYDTETIWEQELRLKNAAGEYRWHLSRCIPVRDSSGAVLRWVATSTDIHEQKVAEASLRESERRHRATLEAARIGTWEFDLEKGRISYHDNREQVFGLSPGLDIEYGDVSQFIYPDDREMLAKAMESTIRTGVPLDIEFRVLRPDATIGWVCGKGSFITDEITGQRKLMGIAMDITVTKQAQQLLEELNTQLEARVEERTAELRAAVAELEGFAYTVSHDLRAPLRAINANSRILQQDYADSLSPEANEHLSAQAEAARKMGTLIDQLLRYSRIAREEIEREAVDLSALANTIVDELRVVGPAHEAQFEIESGLQAHGDPRLLKLVLTNLIENAWKFSPQGGSIRFYREAGNGTSAFVVEDQGIGFDTEYSDKLWQPFHRLVRDEEFPGSGIGLANVQRIILRHGGKVWAESELGKGSKFYFSLP